MTAFADWTLLDVIHEGEVTVVYRARDTASGSPAIVKLLDSADDHREQARALAREMETLTLLARVPGVVRPVALRREGPRMGLVLQTGGGVSLRQAGVAGKLTAQEVIDVALSMASTLEGIHARGVIHKDINPSNLIDHGAKGCPAGSSRVELIDFGIATVVQHDSAAYGGSPRIEGTLSYISPEQTGRLNRSLDYRTDYYSLGATLFELAVGVAPFQADDPIALIHAHVAQEPPAPHERRPGFPRSLSAIILKLLAKDADARYQTAAGLRFDLEMCLELIASGRGDEEVRLGEQDRPHRFRLTHRLYARDAEIAVLDEALQHAMSGDTSIVAVKGPGGVGKSILVNELRGPLTARHGYFVAGKCEQGPHTAPYLPIRQVVAALVDHILTESPDRVAEWRSVILRATSNPELLVDLCPGLAAVIGVQPPIRALSALEARHRLHQTLDEFFTAIASSGKPLCVFLDDLQWADIDTLNVIKKISRTRNRRQLLAVCAYRAGTGASSRSAFVDRELEALSMEGRYVRRITLQPLSKEALQSLIADAVAATSEASEALAEIVFTRTAGNPFFARAFLQSLNADGLLTPSGPSGLDLGAIRRRSATDNVVDLLVERLGELPPATREMLPAAATLGNGFELRTLCRVAPEAAPAALLPAIEAGLIYPIVPIHAPSELHAESPLRFCFAHDRVQQAVLASLSEQNRDAWRLEVGRRLRDAAGGHPPATWLFDVVGHLNQVQSLISDPEERLQLAEHNLEAARLALLSAAGKRALALASAGTEALGADRWERHYELTLELGLIGAEGAFMGGDRERLDVLAQEIVRCARRPLDLVRIKTLQGQLHYSEARASEAIAAYVDALEQLGVKLPASPSPEEVAEQMRLTAEALELRPIEDLGGLPDCRDPRAAQAMQILSKLVFATLVANSQLQSVVVCHLVRMSTTYGNRAESAIGYIFFGLLLTHRQQYETAVRFGRLALAVAEKFGDRSVLAQTYLYANYQLLHWTTPLSELVAPLLRAYEYGIQAGEPLTAAIGATTYCIARLLSGADLDSLASDMERLRGFVQQSGGNMVLNWHEIHQQTVHNLRTDGPSPSVLAGPFYDEHARLAKHRETNDLSALFSYHFEKMQLCVLFGDAAGALSSADQIRPLAFFASAFWAVQHNFLDSMARLMALDFAKERRSALLEDVAANQSKLLEWLPHNRSVIEHKMALVEAELARATGETERAVSRYMKAVELIPADAGPHDKAIASERAGRFFLESDQASRARQYLRRAQLAFGRWGAAAKANQLQREFPHLLPRAISGPVTVAALLRGEDWDFQPVEFANVLNGCRTISQEIHPHRLMQTLLKVIIECAGAQRGYVLMQDGERWVVEAGRDVDGRINTTLESFPVDPSPPGHPSALPMSIIRYAARTRECVLLDDAAQSERFYFDEYVASHKVRSVLCLPLLRQGEVLGIVYLENASLRGAFSANNVVVLEVLAAQAVISLENARLYERLEQQVQEKSHQLAVQAKLAALGAVTAGIAHEIKNPLNFVANFGHVSVQLAKDIAERLHPDSLAPGRPASDEVRDMLNVLQRTLTKVVEHGMRASGIVDAMASHGASGSGGFESIDVNSLVEDAVRAVTAETENTVGIGIRTDFDPVIGPVEAIGRDVNRVLLNLLNNARQAVASKKSLNGDAYAPEIVVATRAFNDRVEISVRDNGPGIADELRARVFTPFFTTKPLGEGTGLGLSISHDIVTRLHRGSLRLNTVEGEFADFVVILPRRRPSADQDLSPEGASTSRRDLNGGEELGQ